MSANPPAGGNAAAGQTPCAAGDVCGDTCPYAGDGTMKPACQVTMQGHDKRLTRLEDRPSGPDVEDIAQRAADRTLQAHVETLGYSYTAEGVERLRQHLRYAQEYGDLRGRVSNKIAGVLIVAVIAALAALAAKGINLKLS